MIKISHLNCPLSFGPGLHDINFEIKKGEVVAVIGPSGVGKSALLRCIPLLLKPSSGKIIIDDKNLLDPLTNIYQVRKHIGFVFQEPTLFLHKMLIENVMMGQMDLLGRSKQEAFDLAKKYLRLVGLGEKLYAFPHELSRGQQQRGEIARCLAMQPDILLLDSVTSELDPVSTSEVNAVINRLAQDGMTMLLSSNDLKFCQNIADHVIYMEDFRIVEQGTPDALFNHPQFASTKAFVQQLHSFVYEIHSKEFDLYELNSMIEYFARDYFLSKHAVRNMELIIEELILHNLLNHTDNLRLQFSYYETEQRMIVTLHYDGVPYNPFDSDEEDILSMLVVRQLTQNVHYEFSHKNILDFVIII